MEQVTYNPDKKVDVGDAFYQGLVWGALGGIAGGLGALSPTRPTPDGDADYFLLGFEGEEPKTSKPAVQVEKDPFLIGFEGEEIENNLIASSAQSLETKYLQALKQAKQPMEEQSFGLSVDTEYLPSLSKDALESAREHVSLFLSNEKSFEDVLEDYTKIYVDTIFSNKEWSWRDTIPGGEHLTKGQKKAILQQAGTSNMIPKVPVTKTDGQRYGYADFEAAHLVVNTVYLPEELWTSSDYHQHKWLNEQIGGKVSGHTWHHTEIPGKMQLVPYGIHQITTHNGGRTPGSWAYKHKKEDAR